MNRDFIARNNIAAEQKDKLRQQGELLREKFNARPREMSLTQFELRLQEYKDFVERWEVYIRSTGDSYESSVSEERRQTVYKIKQVIEKLEVYVLRMKNNDESVLEENLGQLLKNIELLSFNKDMQFVVCSQTFISAYCTDLINKVLKIEEVYKSNMENGVDLSDKCLQQVLKLRNSYAEIKRTNPVIDTALSTSVEQVIESSIQRFSRGQEYEDSTELPAEESEKGCFFDDAWSDIDSINNRCDQLMDKINVVLVRYGGYEFAGVDFADLDAKMRKMAMALSENEDDGLYNQALNLDEEVSNLQVGQLTSMEVDAALINDIIYLRDETRLLIDDVIKAYGKCFSVDTMAREQEMTNQIKQLQELQGVMPKQVADKLLALIKMQNAMDRNFSSVLRGYAAENCRDESINQGFRYCSSCIEQTGVVIDNDIEATQRNYEGGVGIGG